MGYIKQLSEELIKKIAAGEVIERPASVVKELVENSIDANSKKIEIEINRSCKYIKVSDDGNGISPDDINLLFIRHATSKLKDFDDLWNIASLGFRGEALASISSVSKIICKSKHINEENGFEVKVLDGKIDRKTCALAKGTIFEIDDLFYNVPARQKFLKSESTEFGHIYDVILPLAISHSDISFTLIHNGNVVLKSSGSNDLEQVILELLGQDLKNNLVLTTSKNHFLNLNGFISLLEVVKRDKKSIFIFVNKRPVKCHIVSKAIFSAYEGLLPNGKSPVVILNLDFKPRFVDVNVHPTKKEVRYIHPNDVYNIVLHSIQNAISEHYKKEYKEKSVYSIKEDLQTYRPIDLETSRPSYSEAAFDFYSPSLPKTEEIVKPVVETIHELSLLFSVNNLKCQITFSNKPIANMSQIGNKTIFEVGSIFDDDLQIVFSGEIFGDEGYQKEFFNYLSDLSKKVYENYTNSKIPLQNKVLSKELEDEEFKEVKRKKPPQELLYEVWERDNWTCVYCGKQLLDPKVVKEAMPKAKDAFVTYIKEGKEVTNHVLREHTASYDHYLPVSKLPQFNYEIENLFACCFKCNRDKLDSMELEAWKPKRQNNWNKPLEVAEICFETPKMFSKSPLGFIN